MLPSWPWFEGPSRCLYGNVDPGLGILWVASSCGRTWGRDRVPTQPTAHPDREIELRLSWWRRYQERAAQLVLRGADKIWWDPGPQRPWKAASPYRTSGFTIELVKLVAVLTSEFRWISRFVFDEHRSRRSWGTEDAPTVPKVILWPIVLDVITDMRILEHCETNPDRPMMISR